MNTNTDNPSKALQYYEFYICPFCRPVRFLLEANGVPYEKHHIDLTKKENRSEAYKQINPFMKVPAIIDDNVVLFESNAIMRYLCNSKKVDEYWYPLDLKKQALIDAYLEWNSGNIWNLIRWAYVKSGLTIYTRDMTLDQAKKISDKAFQEFENGFLTKRKFLASDDYITIADLAVSYHLGNALMVGYEASSRVKQYYKDAVENMPRLGEDIEEYYATRKEVLKYK